MGPKPRNKTTLRGWFMADTAEFISRLEGARPVGPGRWLARCPAHDDKTPSLSVREAEDGRTLLTCFAGCDAGAVAGAVGLTLRDLFPRGSKAAAYAVRTPVPVVDVLDAIEVDALTVCVIASDLAKGAEVTPERKEKLFKAAGRISAAIEYGKERRYDPRYR